MSDNTDGAVAPAETETADIESQAAPVGETATNEATEATTEATTEAASGDDSTETEAKEAKKNSFQERINQKTRQAKEAEERAKVAEERAQMLEQQIQAEETKPYPKLEDFGYDEQTHQQAVMEWNAEVNGRQVNTAMAKQERMQAEQMQRQAQEAVLTTFRERSAAFADEHPDYVQTITNPAVPMGKAVTQAVVMSDNGAAIAYHLGKNPQLAAEIDSLPPPMQLMRIGEIAGQLSRPVEPKTTQAPPPAKTKVNGSAAVSKDLDKLQGDDYRRARGYI